MKYSMILQCVRYGDFDKDYMILPGVRYVYLVKDCIAILVLKMTRPHPEVLARL
jgi:hypothetical protein